MQVEFDPAYINELLSQWHKLTESPMRDQCNIHTLQNRRAILTNYKRTAATWYLLLGAMKPIDGESEFAELYARVESFMKWASDELVKLAQIE